MSKKYSENNNQKQILFIEGCTTAFTFKLAKVLKKHGYETVLITIMGLDIAHNKEAFDKIITLDAVFLKASLKNLPHIISYSFQKSKDIIKAYNSIRKLKPHLIIGRATPNWLCVLFKHFFWRYPFVYFPYDIRSFGSENFEQVKKAGIPRFEINAEKYCFENSDGIIHKGDENELKYLNKNLLGDIKIKAPVLHFPPYCLKEFMVPINKNKLSKKDKELHLVYVGHVNTEAKKEELFFWDDSIKYILDQKIHLHLYGKSGNVTDEDFKKNFDNSYLFKFLKNKYFHLHPPLDPKKLIKEISKYDYGIWLGEGYSKSYHTKFSSGNKLASYFESGLPFVHYKNIEFIGKILKGYGLDLAISPEEIKDLKKFLEKVNYKQCIEKLKKARNDFEIETNIPRFEEFVEKVREYHKSKNKDNNHKRAQNY